jgi:hypothetical protein
MATKKSRKSKKSKKFKLCKAHVALIFIIAVVALFVLVTKPTAVGTQTPELNITPTPTPEPTPEVTTNETKTVAYSFPGGTPPQLKIISFINTPTFPKVNETALIRTYVKNVGSDSPATTALLKINGKNVATLDVPPIYRNAQAVLQYNFTATATGVYIAEVDVTPVPGEKTIDDNNEQISFTVY